MNLKQMVVGLLFLAVIPASHSAILTYSFDGEVTSIANDDSTGVFGSTFSAGQAVHGTYTIDTASFGFLIRPTFALYVGSSFDVMIGGQHFYGSAAHRVFNDDAGFTNTDAFSIINETGTYASPMIGNLVSSTFFIQFLDYTKTALSNTGQVLSPNISDFGTQINGLRLDNRNDANDFGNLYFSIRSLHQVPEPTSLSLLGLGFAASVLARKRKSS